MERLPEEIAQWDLEWLRPEFAIGPLDVSYTRLILEVGQSTSVQALLVIQAH